MPYANFTLDGLQQTFGLTVLPRDLFSGVPPVAPPGWLLDMLRRGRTPATVSEKARSEFIVAPILLACQELLQDTFTIYSGTTLEGDPERGLTGECDFILARTPPLPILQAPVMVIVEAKKQDIEEGLGQCAAQMLGAQAFNRRHQTPINPLYGCLTTGETWQFLQLDGSQLLIDTNRYFIIELDKLLGIFTTILNPPPSQKASDAA
jgi:hypothetical protein